MKKLICCIIMAFICLNLNAQHVLSDAILLRNYTKIVSEDYFQIPNKRGMVIEQASDSVIAILSRYFNLENRYDSVGYFLNENPFFSGFEFAGSQRSSTDVNKILSKLPELAASFGSIDVTNLALGLSDFLIERTKTELNTAFFKRMNDHLGKDEYRDLRTLLPNTVKLLNVIGTEIYQYDLYLNSLRNAFERDLRSLIHSASKVIQINKASKHFAENQGLYEVMMLSFDVAALVQNNSHPGEALKHIAENHYIDSLKDKPAYKHLVNAIQTLALFSESLRSTSDTSYWVSHNEIQKLKDETTLRIYLGLLYQQVVTNQRYAGIEFGVDGKQIRLDTILFRIGDEWSNKRYQYESVRNFVFQLSILTERVHAEINRYPEVFERVARNENISARERNKLMFEASYDVYFVMSDLIKFSENIGKLPYVNISLSVEQNSLFQKLTNAGEIAIHISNKQYGGAVIHSIILLDSIISSTQLNGLLKYGTFMAALIDADSPEQAKATIEAVALPPGSYSIKRHSKFNISLNGYLGGFFGTEVIDGLDGKRFNNLSLSAPVGVYAGWGICPRSKNPGSVGIFLPVIDLGTIASFRFGDDVSETLPVVKLYNIIAPGLFLEIGIPSTPITFAYGLQMGPNLRRIDESITEASDFYWRHGLTLKVDVPIFNFTALPPK